MAGSSSLKKMVPLLSIWKAGEQVQLCYCKKPSHYLYVEIWDVNNNKLKMYMSANIKNWLDLDKQKYLLFIIFDQMYQS